MKWYKDSASSLQHDLLDLFLKFTGIRCHPLTSVPFLKLSSKSQISGTLIDITCSGGYKFAMLEELTDVSSLTDLSNFTFRIRCKENGEWSEDIHQDICQRKYNLTIYF